MSLRGVLFVLSLTVAGCGSDDNSCANVERHVCLFVSCCDPVCRNIPTDDTCADVDVGYECGLFESVCTCGDDHLWSCRSTIPVRDLSIHVDTDMAERASD